MMSADMKPLTANEEAIVNEISRLHDAVTRMKARAETAEARAAELLESNREQAEAIATLRAERDEAQAYMARMDAERDKALNNLDLANAHAARLMAERDELARKLEQVQRTLKAIDRIHSEAFNESDGVYRP